MIALKKSMLYVVCCVSGLAMFVTIGNYIGTLGRLIFTLLVVDCVLRTKLNKEYS